MGLGIVSRDMCIIDFHYTWRVAKSQSFRENVPILIILSQSVIMLFELDV